MRKKRLPSAPSEPFTPDLSPLSLDEEETLANIAKLGNLYREAHRGEKLDKLDKLLESHQKQLLDDHRNNADTGEAPLSQICLARAGAKFCRFIISFFHGARPMEAMVKAGVTWGEINLVRWENAEFRNALDYIHDQWPKLLELKAMHVGQAAMDGEDVPKHALNFAQFVLKSTNREVFGEHREVATAAANAPQVVYNINLTPPPPPRPCENSVRKQADETIIDIK